MVASFNTSCDTCPIRHRAVCSRCETDELAELEQIKYYRSLEPGQTLIWAGDEMEFVASVVSGAAMISQTMEDGRRQMVGLLLPSDFIGRPGRRVAAYDVVAVTALRICCFRRQPFETLIEKTPHIGLRLMEIALDELDAAREWMLLLGRKTARERIASLLTIIARRHESLASAPENAAAFDLPLTREQIADYLGMTLETASRQISALRRENLIVLTGPRQVSIPDVSALSVVAGDDDRDAA